MRAEPGPQVDFYSDNTIIATVGQSTFTALTTTMGLQWVRLELKAFLGKTMEQEKSLVSIWPRKRINVTFTHFLMCKRDF